MIVDCVPALNPWDMGAQLRLQRKEKPDKYNTGSQEGSIRTWKSCL